MALNTYSDISAFVGTIFDDALFAARENSLMIGLVSVPNAVTGMAVRTLSEYNKGTARDIGESDDLVGTTFTPSVLNSLTPSEVGLQFFLTDQRIDSDPFGARNDAAMELGLALADKIETDLLGELDALTGGTIGTAGSSLTWGHFYSALSVLRAAKAPLPYACVLHPFQWHDLAAAAAASATVTNAPNFQDEIMRRWFVGQVTGVDIYVCGNISSGTSVYGGMFARQAIAFDQRRAPRLEPERDASRRGWELNMTGVYAHGVWRSAFGVSIVSDASTPTG